MKWIDIKMQYQDQFILLEEIVEEKVAVDKYRVLSGKVIKISNDFNEIRKLYRERKEQGKSVLYALPGTPEDFIIEEVPFMGILS
jgi:hypothetical protein